MLYQLSYDPIKTFSPFGNRTRQPVQQACIQLAFAHWLWVKIWCTRVVTIHLPHGYQPWPSPFGLMCEIKQDASSLFNSKFLIAVSILKLVGMAGIEPATSSFQTRPSTADITLRLFGAEGEDRTHLLSPRCYRPLPDHLGVLYFYLAIPDSLELPTPAFGAQYSTHLS